MSGQRTGQTVLGQLDLSSAVKIRIQSHEGTVTLIQSGAGGWKVKEQNNFPANMQKIKTLLVKLTTETVAHRTTDKKEKMAGLNVLTAKENGGKWEKNKTGRLVNFLDAKEQTLFGLILGRDRGGETNSGYGGTYIRYAGEDDVYMIKDTVLIDFKAEDWIVKTVFDEKADQVIKSMRIRKPGSPELVFTRAKPEGAWAMAGVPTKQFKQSEAKGLANLIAGLDLSKVAQAPQSQAKLGRKETGIVVFEFFDKRKFTMDIGLEKADDQFRYITIKGDLDGSVSDPKLKEKVQSFNTRFAGHLLAIYDWDGKQLTREKKDFLVAQKVKQKEPQSAKKKSPRKKSK